MRRMSQKNNSSMYSYVHNEKRVTDQDDTSAVSNFFEIPQCSISRPHDFSDFSVMVWYFWTPLFPRNLGAAGSTLNAQGGLANRKI